jgi:redox-sensitive bicupin YhaK (pirin superfamily)
MTRIIRAQDRHYLDREWLQTYWLFSFSHYYDPDNLQFGALRVFNDDVVQPGTGFPTHPHQEMEIITVPLSGEMTHRDSMGNTAVIRAGDVQRMSAGTGLTHSEYNLAADPVHFYQIWIFPDRAGLPPTYDQRAYDPEVWRNRLAPVASGQGLPDVVTFHTDATIYRAELEAGKAVCHAADGSRRLFAYVTRGHLTVDGARLAPGDQARIDPTAPTVLQASAPSDVILIDVPSCRGWGYGDETLRGDRA